MRMGPVKDEAPPIAPAIAPTTGPNHNSVFFDISPLGLNSITATALTTVKAITAFISRGDSLDPQSFAHSVATSWAPISVPNRLSAKINLPPSMDCSALDTSTGITNSPIALDGSRSRDSKGTTTNGNPTPSVPLTTPPVTNMKNAVISKKRGSLAMPAIDHSAFKSAAFPALDIAKFSRSISFL